MDAPGSAGGRGGRFCSVHDLCGPPHRSHDPPGMDRLSTQNAPLILALAHLPVAFLALGENWHGGHHWRFLCRSDVCGLCSATGIFCRGWGASRSFLRLFSFSPLAPGSTCICSGNVLRGRDCISVLAIVSKLIGCGLPLWQEGWRSALQVGVGMMPRGEVALIVALVGLQSQIVSQSTYAIVVFMTAVTTCWRHRCCAICFALQRRQKRGALRLHSEPGAL